MQTMVNNSCLKCNKDFEVLASEVRRGGGKFCSRSCSSSFNARRRTKKSVEVVCALCSKAFSKKPSKATTKSGLHFCCRAHKDLAQRLDSGFTALHPDHYGNGQGTYRKRAMAAFPHQCVGCGYKRYAEVLHVHHKDRNRNNNELSNLELLCPTCHEEDHFLHGDGRWTLVP